MSDPATPSAAPAATTPPPDAGKPAPAAAPAQPAPQPTGFAERVAKEAAKREVESLKARLAELEPKAKEAETLRSWRDGLKLDPTRIKDVLGDNWYDAVTEARLGTGLTAEQAAKLVDERLSEAETKKAAEAKAAAAKAAEQAEAEMAAWRSDVVDFVKAAPNDYRLVNLHGAHNAVAEWIEQNYKSTARLATNAEGAAAVEANIKKAVLDSLTEDLVQEWMKSRQPASSSGATREVPKVGTLHNGMTSSTPPPGPRLTLEQRQARAIQLLKERQASKTG